MARRRRVVQLTNQAYADLKRLARQDRYAYQDVKGTFEILELAPHAGYPLRREWKGCWALHVGRDRYRVIWEIFPPEPDYDGAEGDEIEPVVVLRIGPKVDAHGRTIYEDPRPSRED